LNSKGKKREGENGVEEKKERNKEYRKIFGKSE
jgi:hypothetical protein